MSPLFEVVVMLLAGLVIFSALGKDPIQGFRLFFFNPVRNLYGVSELLLKAAPLMLCAVGLAIGFRANVWNIGAEGQFIFGAIGASGVALYFKGSGGPLLLPAMLCAGALAGAAWAAIPALLRTRFNANEILVTLMLVYVAQLYVSWLVFGPWRDPMGFGFPQTEMFGRDARLPNILAGTRLNAGIFIALGVLVAGYLFMQFSYTGYKMRVAGEAAGAARYAGFSASKTVWIGLLCGGGAAGIAGMTEVAGPMGQLTDRVSLGYGFAAIIVAFVGRLNPIGIALASLLMALLFLGGEQVQQHMNLPSSISMVFQGMLLFFLLGADVFINYRLRFGRMAR
ncbi:ABC transporter permease [Azoarcus taiwanensis]|uniref:ABC transporter permease n=1 Tax=Azoarcus taiwanensis TaxID=666964 RepID=A0A972FEE9_9RHOO|nr:ABC transporter permease [Azoarcus taiwanensis]NMG05234.1 ABC transporter permease [Azoarcus taiwanensis]